MSTGQTYNARTYGKKSSAKRRQSIELNPESRKRRKASTSAEELTDVEETEPSTPKQAMASFARDLSGIFESFSPKASPAPTPTKLARRMLARSKTDSSIENTSANHLDRTPSLPNLPSSSPPISPVASKNIRPPPVPVPVTTNTRTYAGKSRSFLVAIPASSLDPLAIDQGEDDSTRESYASLRSRWGVDNSEDDPYPGNPSPTRSDSTSTPGATPTKARRKAKDQYEALLRAKIPLANGMMNPLKSITELRSQGESRRFLDEVGYLFEGMDPTVGIGLKRASALEIVTKLCDAEFARKAKVADFLGRAWNVFIEAGAGRGEDKILDTLLAFFAALVSQDPASLRDLAQRPPLSPSPPTAGSSKITSEQQSNNPTIVDILFSILNAPSDPLALVSVSLPEEKAKNEAELKKLGVGKKDRATFQTIHDTILSKSYLFPPDTPISTPLLVLLALQAFPPALIPGRHLSSLLTSLRHFLSPILYPAPFSGYLSWPDAKTHIAFETIHCALRLLDGYLLDQWGVDEDSDEGEQRKVRKANEAEVQKARGEWFADGLIALGVCAELAGSVSARNCLQVTFRVLVSLTHSDEAWGQKVVECECALAFIFRVILGFRSSGDNSNIAKKEEDTSKPTPETSMQGNTKIEEGGDGDHTPHVLDTLYLALGLLTNLVQVVDGVKDLLRDFRIDPSCILRKRSCIRSCTCPHPITALDILIKIYTLQTSLMSLPSPFPQPIKSEPSPSETDDPSNHSTTDSDSDSVFLRGHLSVLFGLLMRDSTENEAYILEKLGGPTRLVEHARDFAAFYDAFGDQAEGRVAREVVTFLEGL